MRWLKWGGLVVVCIVLLAFVAVGIGLVVTRPAPPPAGSASAMRISDGPYSVGRAEFNWVDHTRATPANGSFPGAEARELPTLIWYPEDYDGASPLVIYSHGFRSNREGGVYIAEYLASHGYIVASANFPLSNGAAPGGATIEDVPNQPGDISFLIDTVLSLQGDDKPFAGRIDSDRIAAIGLSLGGLTTTLVTFHPEWRDPRIALAVSMAGPADVFGASFFEHADVPYLVISGTEDAIVPHRTNAAPIPEKIRVGGLLEINGGTHAGFAGVMSGPMRLMGNPDVFACSVSDFGSGGHPFDGMFGDQAQGMVSPEEYIPACSRELGATIRAGRQQMIAKLAIRAFLDAEFAESPEERIASLRYYTETLSDELPEVEYLPGKR